MSGTGTRSEVSFLKTNRLLSEPSTKEELLSSIEKQKDLLRRVERGQIYVPDKGEKIKTKLKYLQDRLSTYTTVKQDVLSEENSSPGDSNVDLEVQHTGNSSKYEDRILLDIDEQASRLESILVVSESSSRETVITENKTIRMMERIHWKEERKVKLISLEEANKRFTLHEEKEKTHVEKILRQSSISSLTDKKPSNKTVSDAIEIADLGNFSDNSEDLSVVDEESDVDSTDDD